MLELKKISADAVPSALEMAHRYRLLNEPQAAESICRDILEVEPTNEQALITLLLALTDNFSNEITRSFSQAKEVVERLAGHSLRSYYSGVIYERRAKAHLRIGGPNAQEMAYSWLEKAMQAFDEALTRSEEDNQEAVLRWNACARLMNEYQAMKPTVTFEREGLLDSYETPH